MPRRKPDEVKVHRIELGDFERDKVADTFQMAALATGAGVLAAGAGVAVAGAGAWFTMRKLYGWKDDVAEAFDKVTDGLGAEVIFGKGTYTDADGNEVQNPFAGIPVMGSLFGSGIMIGQRFNPFAGSN